MTESVDLRGSINRSNINVEKEGNNGNNSTRMSLSKPDASKDAPSESKSAASTMSRCYAYIVLASRTMSKIVIYVDAFARLMMHQYCMHLTLIVMLLVTLCRPPR